MEEYKIINGYKNYEISNLGNVKNIKTGRIIKTRLYTGYFMVDLRKYNIRKTISIHRLIANTFIENPENKLCVDYIDGNKLNNNIKNLRWATNSENGMNRKLNLKNKTGFTGIRFRCNKYIARIGYNNIYYSLGTFEILQEAIEARINKSQELFGEYQSNHEKDLIINLNIKANSKRNIIINLNIEDEEYKKLEEEFEQKIN